MKKPGGWTRFWGLLLWGVAALAWADYRDHPKAGAFVEQMLAESDLSREVLEAGLAKARRRTDILELMARPAEKTKTWAEYRPIFLGETRIRQGIEFWRDNAQALRNAEKRFGVPAEYIVAIIGVETRYGRVTGRHRVLDALATLAFDYPPRSAFFARELGVYLQLAHRQGFDPASRKGSYAGAMGVGQFMPSSYRHYAVDGDGDGRVDIWDNRIDAIASVANYLAEHGWQRGQYVAIRARPEGEPTAPGPSDWQRPHKSVAQWRESGLTPVLPIVDDRPASALLLSGPLGEETWLTLGNFYAITRYNHSPLYALAVTQLAEAIRRSYRKGSEETD